MLASSPTPEVAFACGSASMSKTFLPNFAIEADRLIAVVVFPTPPFWFDIEITFFRNLIFLVDD